MPTIMTGVLVVMSMVIGYLLGTIRRIRFSAECEMDGCYADTRPDANYCSGHRTPRRQYE